MPNYNDGLSKEEIQFLVNKVAGSTRFFLILALEELIKNKFQRAAQLYEQSYKADPNDLETFRIIFNSDGMAYVSRHLSFTKKEYCQKAVELKQWDHIYYLTKNRPSSTWQIESLIGCLEGDNRCTCLEAVKLVAGHWPKSYLLSAELTNPHADLLPESYYKEHEEKLKKLIKELYGRDLDKE